MLSRPSSNISPSSHTLIVTRHTTNTELRERDETNPRSIHATDSRSLSQPAYGMPASGYNSPPTLSEQLHDDRDTVPMHSHARYYTSNAQSRESSQAPPLKPYDAFANAHATPHNHSNRPLLGVRTNPPSRVNSPLSPSSHKYSGTTVYSQQYATHDSLGYQPPPGPPPTNVNHTARPAPSQHRSSYLNVGSDPRTRSHTPYLAVGADASDMIHGTRGHLSANYTRRVVSQEPIASQWSGPPQPFGHYAAEQIHVQHGGKETHRRN